MKCPKCGSDSFYRLDSESKSDLGQCQIEACGYSMSEQYVIGYWDGVGSNQNQKARPMLYLKTMKWAVPAEGIKSVHVSHISPTRFLFWKRRNGSVGVEVTYPDKEMTTTITNVGADEYGGLRDRVVADVEATILKGCI